MSPRIASLCLCCLLMVFAVGAQVALAADAAKPNVLFLAVDDLRPQLGCYGHEQMVSPNIDRLAADGLLFEQASCMVPTCGASRSSLMSGIRPARNRFVSYTARADKEVPGVTTLNTHFKNHGYYTLSLGKVFHFQHDSTAGWSEPAWRPKTGGHYALAESKEIAAKSKKGRGLPYECADVPDATYGDGMIANQAVKGLQRLAAKDQPFFLAVGFMKPHLPFVAPKKYWDLYDAAEIRLPETYHRPKDAPDEAIHGFGELRAYAQVPPKGPVSDEMALKMIHGYYACVSYTDAQIGKVLAELDRLGLRDDTIVILWADHGWNLGEHTLWCKHCTFETSMHAPLMIRVPDRQGGQRTKGLIEFIDIYPSLSELAGLPLPAHLDGKSFAPLLDNPNQPWDQATLGRFGRGDTLRTPRYRFTEYTDNRGSQTARMLYDHQTDPQEDTNIAEHPKNADLVQQLTKELRQRKGKPTPKK